MKQSRMRPTARSYNALLSACERAGQPDRALEVFANMLRARRNGDLQLQPTAVTYNTLLSACGKAGRSAAVYARDTPAIPDWRCVKCSVTLTAQAPHLSTDIDTMRCILV
jgi:pentatricopeptide repeat protein